jgi:hypothetical protein
MRTTLTLDPDVSELLEQETHRQQKPFKRVVNEALRKGLTRSVRPQHRVRVVGYPSELRSGFDAARFNALADELEDAALLHKAPSPKARRR